MGTRHLICVMSDGVYKVAQYGQWDGYPEGQGVDILEFLSERYEPQKFKNALRLVSFATPEELESEWENCGAVKGKDTVSMDVAKLHDELYPHNSRDTGAGILDIIQNTEKPLKIRNSIDFAGDSLFCEFCYVIDLDKNTFECFYGFQKEPTSGERFSNSKRNDDKYYPVKHAATFELDKLPSRDEFLSVLVEQEPE